MADVIYDKKDQLQKIQAALLPGETIEAVLDMKGCSLNPLLADHKHRR